MPVVFQQPEPMAPEIQSAGAAAQIMQQNNPTLARLYETAMQGQTQASIAGANLAQRNMEARAQAANQGYAIEVQRQEHADALRAAQNVSPRDVFHAQQQQQAAEQHAMLQGWLQNQELSQSESMRLQRMQNAVGEVMSNPDLTDEEKTGLAMQLKTGIDPLRQRVERQKAAMDHELTTKAMNQVAQQEKIREMNDKMWADNAHNGVLEIPDANGTMHKYMRDHKGDPIEVGKNEKSAADKSQNADEGIDRVKLQKEAFAHALAMNPQYDEKTDAGHKALREAAAEIYKDWLGGAQQRQAAKHLPPAPAAVPSLGQSPTAATPATPAVVPTTLPKVEPAEIQKTSDSMRDKAKAASWLPEPQRKEILGMIEERQKLINDYSSKYTPPAVIARYEEITRALRSIPNKPPPDPRKAPPSPVATPNWWERNVTPRLDRLAEPFGENSGSISS